jgi:hypothetical protein
MKIRKFSQFNESSSNFYTELTYDQYFENFNNLVKFYKSDYEFIVNLISKDYKIEYRINNAHVFKDDECGYTNQAPQIMMIGKDKTYVISKKRDEYFIVEICNTDDIKYSNRKGTYYYCDQLDGLSKLLTIKGVTNKVNESVIDTKNKWFDDIKDLFQTYVDEYKLNKVGILTPINDMKEYDYKFIPKKFEVEIIINGSIPNIKNYVNRINKFGYKSIIEENISPSKPYNQKFKFIKIFVINPSATRANVRHYLLESKKDDTLYIFDLDDTLVLNPRFEELAIEYLKEDVTIRSLLQSSNRKIGVTMDKLKWENGKIYVEDPNQEIEIKGNWVRKGKRVYLIPPDRFYFTNMSLPINTTNLSEFYNSVENKAIVTGRANDIKHKIIDSLNKFDLEMPNYGLHCYPAKAQTSDKVALWKAKTIIELIKNSGFKKVEFYDDNSKWVNKVTAMVKKELPDINWSGIKYKHKNG